MYWHFSKHIAFFYIVLFNRNILEIEQNKDIRAVCVSDSVKHKEKKKKTTDKEVLDYSETALEVRSKVYGKNV